MATTAAVAAAIAIPIVGSPAPAARGASGPVLPSKDPFYRYSAASPLAKARPGTILKKRPVTIRLSGIPTPLSAEQLLYRTTDEQRRPSVAVTTVIRSPADLTGGLIGYLSFYDGLGSECDPSYTLTGGFPGNSTNAEQAEEEELLIAHYLLLGWDVTVPDFEGPQEHWFAGQESGYATLDAVRAAEGWLGEPAATTRVGLSGYSGGAVAGDWAAELAPHYAPGIDLAGVALGGIPVDLAHNINYVSGSAEYAGFLPAILVFVQRDFHVSLRRYLSPYGVKLTRRVSHQCLESYLSSYPGLTMQRLLKHRYRHVLRIPAFRHAVNHLIMGRAPGHPKAPIFLAVGDTDGRGDGVMVRRDIEALAREYCRQRVPVRFATYYHQDHIAAGLSFEPAATLDFLQWMNGQPVAGNCAKIGAG